MDRILFSVFRESKASPEVIRVERILELLVSANMHLDHWITFTRVPNRDKILGRAEFIEAVQRGKEAELAYSKALERLNRALERYQWVSEINGSINGFSEDITWSDKVPAGLAVWEHAVVRLLMGLTNVPGEIGRLRRCEDCAQWFYAGTAHQRFCGEACRRRHTANSAEFKDKRRRYMKQTYRPQQKQREIESLALAQRLRTQKGK